MQRHPNAVAAGGSSAASVLEVWALGLAGVDVSPEVAAVLTGLVASATLFVGRRGVRGAFRAVWRGGNQ